MANKLINETGLPKRIANIFAARNIITAKYSKYTSRLLVAHSSVSFVLHSSYRSPSDFPPSPEDNVGISLSSFFPFVLVKSQDALSLTEFELMELLDVGLSEVTSAIAHISEVVCPPCQTVLYLMEHRVQHENLAGHLPTRLKGLDDALCGGLPFGSLTELVGAAVIGKTQFCLKLSLLASLPPKCGGLDGRVIYIDAESKFSSKRLIEIGIKSLPEIFHGKGMAQEMAGRILVLSPTSLSEFTEREWEVNDKGSMYYVLCSC